MKIVFSIKITLISLLLCLANVQSMAADKYCQKANQAKTYDIHIFGYTYKDLNAKKQMARGLTDLFSNLAVGDRVKVYNHNSTGYSLSLDHCVPGCPETSFVEGLFNASCSTEVAKRDRKTFNQRFAQATMAEINRNDSYDIFKSIQDLNDVYKGERTNSVVAVAISMIPDGINPSDPNAFNKFYASNVPNLNIALQFPPVCNVGTSPSSEVMKFWKEVFDLKKVKFDFKPCNKDL
ncbi:MAG: hypothetical protein WCK42_09400 [Myxococcaceae bacterium]